MKRTFIALVVIAAIGGAAYWYTRGDGTNAAAATVGAAGGGRSSRGGSGSGSGGGGGFGGPGGFGPGGGGPRLPMTVEIAQVKRADMSQDLTVVGNLIGAATVEATPKVSGRLESVNVRLGDRVARGQRLAKIEDREILEQVKQAEASNQVGAATIRQREADLKLAEGNLERTRGLFERQLVPRQTFEDTDARYQAAVAQLDLARAQNSQSQARLEELKINLANTIIGSPVSGFIAKRNLDSGAWVTPNSDFISVVDISTVRLVANVVEKDLRRITPGLKADVTVDAFPDEHFNGKIARVSPVLDPTTRTAQIEVEIANAQFRLKPGMYAKVHFTVERHPNTLVVPTNSVVDLGGKRGVFKPTTGANGETAKFHPIQPGLSDEKFVEVASGLDEGDRIVSTGAGALREGDKIVLPGPGGGGTGGRGPRGGSQPGDAGGAGGNGTGGRRGGAGRAAGSQS
jgi:RND family efflux transporter MFP subunit